MVDFWAPWCAPCNRFAPIFAAAAQRNPSVVFGTVNTDDNQDLARVFKIQSIPHLLAFKNGHLVFDQPGTMTGRKINELITQIGTVALPATEA